MFSTNMKNPLSTSLSSTIFNKTDDRLEKNKVRNNGLWRKSNVKEEYEAAFRTNSYIEITTPTDDTSSAPCRLQPDQDLILHDMSFQSSHIDHHLLVHYLEASFQAFETCQLLLQALHQTKISHAIAKRSVVNYLTRRASTVDDDDNGNNGDGDRVVYGELAYFSHLENPFSIASHAHFLALHDTHLELLHDLTHKRNQARRKLRLKKIWKKLGRACFVISNAAVLGALLVLALHSLIGVVAAPGLISCFVSLPKKKRDGTPVSSELVLRQMEIVMRATYITMNDLDTLSRMAARLEGEMEHLRAIGEMWMRSSSRIRSEILKEAVAEDEAIVEQMKELQQHIYLCFLTINRSRRLVMKEIIMGDRDQNG